MAENNAVTKEELKEILAEMRQEMRQESRQDLANLRQEFRQDLAETNQNVMALRHNVDGLEHKVDGLEHKVDGLEHKVDGLEHKVDGLEHKVDTNEQKLEAFRAETMARFDIVDKKHDEVVKMFFALQRDMKANHQEYRAMLSNLMTGMDAEAGEHEIIRHEQLSLGAIQDRHGRRIEQIEKHLGLESNNDKPQKNASKKQPQKRNKKSK